MKALALFLSLAGAAVAILQPLVAFGDARWGAGFGDILNGGVGLGMIVLAGLWSWMILKRERTVGGKK
jgi:hypothetical protein